MGDALVRWPEDSAASDPELVCAACSEVLCTVEEGDALSVLAAVASVHPCESEEGSE